MAIAVTPGPPLSFSGVTRATSEAVMVAAAAAVVVVAVVVVVAKISTSDLP
jgi:hypothetical protein